MVINSAQQVDEANLGAEVEGDGGLQPPEAPVFTTLSVRLTTEDREHVQKLASIAYRWGVIKQDSLSELIRFGLALAEVQVKVVYLQKRKGG